MAADTPRDVSARMSGVVATAAARAMERDLQWYRDLPAEERSWVSLVSQAGISAFLAWYRSGENPQTLTADIFGTAPRELAQKITLSQTLDLVRTTVDTVEEHIPAMASGGDEAQLREGVLRYSREVAFATAQIYASAAETRGAWDARLEALVVLAVVRGEADETFRSRVTELGWADVTAVTVLVGAAPQDAPPGTSAGIAGSLREAAQRMELDALTAVQGQRLICVLGGTSDPLADATRLSPHFGSGPIVVGPAVPHLYAAGRSARAALSGADAATAWPQAPRPVLADDLLAERTLLGEAPARRALVDRVYIPLRDSGSALLETANAYLESGGALEATSRILFVHPNTVRYRLGRIEDLISLDLTVPREAWTAQIALAVGRFAEQPTQPRWRSTTTSRAPHRSP
ncbi:fatty acid biosynthesis transcriptional regulator FasR [soil metagenome]